MNEAQAKTLAKLVGGEEWQTGGGIWVVSIQRDDGHLVVFSGDAVCEYESDEAFDEGRPSSTISLGMDDDFWVIEDSEGNTYYEHDELQLGWRSEYEAQRQARYLQSREGGNYSVQPQQDLLSRH